MAIHMTNKSQNENHYKVARLVMKKLEYLPPVDKNISDVYDPENKHTIQIDSEEMKEETHELEQVEQDEQEEIREMDDTE